MTPEMLTALLGGIAALVIAIGVLITKIGDVLKTTKAIEKNTNGVATAMEADRRALREEVIRLKADLVEETARRVLEGLTADQAASDVRAERASDVRVGEGKEADER